MNTKHSSMARVLAWAFILVSALAAHARASSPCMCRAFPPCFGTQSIASVVTVKGKTLVGPAVHEINGEAPCLATSPWTAPAPSKQCARQATTSIAGSVRIGGKIAPGDWANVGIEVNGGFSQTSSCHAEIKGWCSCCTCACYLPRQNTVLTTVCSARCLFGSDTAAFGSQCIRVSRDIATSHGPLTCTTTWDADNNGKDDCWERIPKPCRATCPNLDTNSVQAPSRPGFID